MYFGKKGELVSFLAVALLVLSAGLILFHEGGLTGAAIGTDINTKGIEIQTAHSISGCQKLNETNSTYTLIANVTSAGTCFSFYNSSITLDCNWFRITYRASAGSYAINSTGGYHNLTVTNCDIRETVGLGGDSAIWFVNVTNSTITNNKITTSYGGTYAIVLDNSSNNIVSYNNISQGGTQAPEDGGYQKGIYLVRDAENNTFINNNITAASYSIDDQSLKINTLFYNDTLGSINWTKTNLTTNMSLSRGLTIFIQDNLSGIRDGPEEIMQLNGSAVITMEGLPYRSSPRTFKIYGGVKKDCNNDTQDSNGFTCNISSYNPTTGVLIFNVSTFSNYTTLAENTTPSVTIDNPVNGSNLSSGLVEFNTTVTDVSNISAVIFMFNTNTTTFNISAYNSSGIRWHNNVNVSTIVEGLHTMTVFANDTVNTSSGNVNQTETVTFYVDRTAPTVNLLNSSYNTSDTTPEVTFNFTDLHPTANCSLYYNGNLNQSNTTTLNNTNTIIFDKFLGNTLNDGSYITTVNCTDSSGNKGNSTAINITVDATSPRFSNNISGPVPHITDGINYTANITLNDDLVGLDWFIFGSSDTGNAVGSIWNRNITRDISGLEYNASVSQININTVGTEVCWYFWFNDTVGNINQTDIYCFTLEAAPGQIVGGGGGSTSDSTTAGRDTTTRTTRAAGEVAPATTTTTERATAGEIAGLVDSGRITSTISSASMQASRGTAVGGGVSTGGGVSRNIEVRNLNIFNGGNKPIELTATLKQEEFALPNEDNIKKKIAMELSKRGITDQSYAERETEAIRLIEKLEVLPAFTGRAASFFPLLETSRQSSTLIKPTGEHISATLLKDRLINEQELRSITILPGETFNKELLLQRGLSLTSKKTNIVFSSNGEEVFSKEFDEQEITAGTDIDVIDEKNKVVDIYIRIPPEEGAGKEKYSVEINFNRKFSDDEYNQQAARSKLPLGLSKITGLFSFSSNVDNKLLGPYDVNPEKGALIAAQYQILKEGKFEVVSKVYKRGTELVAEDQFELDLS